MKKFNLKQDSIELGRSDCFFGAMKKLNPVLFRFCCFYSKKSLVEGFNRLISYYKNLKDAVQDIYDTSAGPSVDLVQKMSDLAKASKGFMPCFLAHS